jgi:hypothetical protein
VGGVPLLQPGRKIIFTFWVIFGNWGPRKGNEMVKSRSKQRFRFVLSCF